MPKLAPGQDLRASVEKPRQLSSVSFREQETLVLPVKIVLCSWIEL